MKLEKIGNAHSYSYLTIKFSGHSMPDSDYMDNTSLLEKESNELSFAKRIRLWMASMIQRFLDN